MEKSSGDNCVTPQTQKFGVLKSLCRKHKEWGLGWKHLPKSCQSNLQLHFQGMKKEKGPGQWHLSQNFSRGHLFMSHWAELKNVAILGCKRDWENKNWTGVLPSQTRLGRTGISNEWDQAVGSGWRMAAPWWWPHVLQGIPSAPW